MTFIRVGRFPMRAVVSIAVSMITLISAASAQSSNPLAHLTLEQLGNVEVTTATKEPAEMRNTPSAIYVLTAEDIRRSGARTLPDALRLVPGVEVAQIDSSKWSVGIRGFGTRLSKSVLVLIDGRSVYTPLFAGVYWEMQDVLLEDIDRIEVIRGPGGTVWGSNAVNGVINIITKSAKDTRGTLISAGGGNVEQGFAGIRYGGANGRFAYRLYGKGFTRGPEYHPNGDNFDDWRRGQFGFRTDSNITDRDDLTIQGDIYRSVVGQELGVSYYSPPSLVTIQKNIDLSGGNLLGRWRHRFQGGSDLQLQAYFDRTDRGDINFREIRNTYDIDFIHHFQLRRQDIIWGAGMRLSPSQFFQVVPTVDFEPHHETYKLFTGFVQDEFAIVPGRLSLTVGTKLEHNSYSGFDAQPSTRILWTPSEHQSVWASFTHAVRTPSRIEEGFQFTALAVKSIPLYLRLIGDGNFSPEKMNGYEIGYRASLGPKLFLDIASFYNHYNDLLSVENLPPVPESSPLPTHYILPIYLRNGIEGNTKGFEIAPAWQPMQRWRLKATYSYLHLDVRRKPGSDDASTVQQTEGASPHNSATFQSLLDLSTNLQLDLTIRYVGNLQFPKIPAYTTADARFAYRLNKSIELSVTGRNLLQPHHFEFSGDPNGPVGIKRSLYGQILYTR